MAEQNQKRQVAVKARIVELLSGKYVKEEGWNPNYVLTKDGRKASRVNLLGTVVSVPVMDMSYRSVMLDDGSGNIPVRSFDESDIFKDVSLGDIVFVIGRPREYGNELYIMPEIIKKVANKSWIEVRRLETEKNIISMPAPEPDSRQCKEPEINEECLEDEPAEGTAAPEPAKESSQSEQQKVYSLVKELDTGNGAEFEQILEKAGSANAEKIISQLLMEGEIFELGKGRLKVLE